MYFDILQNSRLLFVRLFQRRKGVFVIAEAQIGVHECAGRNVPLLISFLQFFQQSKSIVAPSRMCVRPNQSTDYSGTTVRKSKSLLQFWNRSLRLIVCGEHESKIEQDTYILRC